MGMKNDQTNWLNRMGRHRTGVSCCGIYISLFGITEMNLREMMTERILFAVDEVILATEFDISPDEIAELSDLDFLELYEEVNGFLG
jgi:hypothetical protein